MVRKVLLRADADAKMGAGHLMRCVALARAFGDAGIEPTIATASTDRSLLASAFNDRIRFQFLDGAYPDPRDALRVAALIESAEIDAVVVDGYVFDNAYLDAIAGKSVRKVVVDDAPRLSHYACDVLLDVNLGSLRRPYPLRDRQRALLGPRFTLLRPQFLGAARGAPCIRSTASRILVTMGASDPPNATALVLRALASHPSFEVTVVVGGANPHATDIDAVSRSLSRVRILRNVAGIERVMAEADLAIGAVGGTMWELAYMGVPTLILSACDLHDQVATVASAYGAHSWIGNVDRVDPSDIGDAVGRLASDPATRTEMSRLGRALVDGHGAARIVSAVATDTGEWHVRRAGPADGQPIWELLHEQLTVTNQSYRSFEREFMQVLSDGSRAYVCESLGSVAAFVEYSSSAGSPVVRAGVAAAYRAHGVLDRLVSLTAPTSIS
jgi:UDP-2,4-diacetamido-2,4,6-trideoxy-beta-L-altropyranose hydrolase